MAVALLYRKTMQTLLNSLQKEYGKWKLEEKSGKTKSIILMPGTAIADQKEHDEALKKMKSENNLILRQVDFAICSSCRWSTTGGGCRYCNIDKEKEYLHFKDIQKKQAENAIARAIELARELAISFVVDSGAAEAAGSAGSSSNQSGGGEGANHFFPLRFCFRFRLNLCLL